MFLQNNMGTSKKCESDRTRNKLPRGQDALILRFMGYWDDRFQEDGELHFYEIRFYLEDDTMELLEEIVEESGVDTKNHRVFVKRQKFVKRQQLPTVSPISFYFE